MGTAVETPPTDLQRAEAASAGLRKQLAALVDERQELQKQLKIARQEIQSLKQGKRLPLPDKEITGFQRRLDGLQMHEKFRLRDACRIFELDYCHSPEAAMEGLREKIEWAMQWIRDNSVAYLDLALRGGTLYAFAEKKGNGNA